MADPLVLVTGASGYLATYVVKALQDAGYRVRGTVRSTKDAKKVQHLYDLCPDAKHKLELVEADLTNADSWIPAVQGCTYVQHVASPFPLSQPRDENEVIKPAVDGTLGVLKACASVGGVKRVVLTSSTVAISRRQSEPCTEETWSDLTDAIPYAKSKHLAEKAAWDFVQDLPEDKKFELAVVNPSFIIGPPLHGGGGTSTEITVQMITKLPMIPKCNTSVIDIRDCAEAHLKCMTLPEAAGHRHILVSKAVWFPEVAQFLAKELNPQGYRVSTREMPNWLLWLGSFFSTDMNTMYQEGRFEIPLSNDRMRNVLKIEPIPWEKSYSDMAHVLIQRGFIPKTDKYTGPTQ